MKYKRLRTGHDYHIFEFTLKEVADALFETYENDEELQTLRRTSPYEIEYNQETDRIVIKGKTFFENLEEMGTISEEIEFDNEKKETNIDIVFRSIYNGYNQHQLIVDNTRLTSKQVSNAIYHLIKTERIKRMDDKTFYPTPAPV